MTKPRTVIALVVEDPAWRRCGVDLSRLRTAARLAVSRAPGRDGAACDLTLLLTDDARLRALNARFRGRDAPTNVLSFPAAANAHGHLGDVAIALGIARQEATTAGIGLMARTLHLTVHGVLHLLGYDHVRTREAEAMERLEIAVLKTLGCPNPYARAAAMK